MARMHHYRLDGPTASGLDGPAFHPHYQRDGPTASRLDDPASAFHPNYELDGPSASHPMQHWRPRLDPADIRRVVLHLQQSSQVAELLVDPLPACLQSEWVPHHRQPRCLIDVLGRVMRHGAMEQIVLHR